MGIYQIVIQKQLGTEYWVNDYHVDVATGVAAKIEAEKLVDIERDNTQSIVSFVNYRVRPAGAPGPNGTVVPIGENGLAATGPYMPLFNVLRVDLSPDFGRPGRKYYKFPFPNAWNDNGQVPGSAISALQTTLISPLLALGTLCSSSGVHYTTAAVFTRVGMRQLRRGSKRREEPII